MSRAILNRYLNPLIKADLGDKIVLLSGPRQVGKTTLALRLLGANEGHPAYFNWDYEEDQRRLLAQEFPPHERLLVFDEIHKYRRWRNWLKGIYDKTKSSRQYLVTGSARLDLYRRGGDALTGRTHFYRLHPFSLREVDPECKVSTFEELWKFGGFPEPFLSQSLTQHRRWQRERTSQVLREDLRDLEKVEEVVLLSRLVERLPDLVGSPLSVNALREDLQVAHRTVQNWLFILERLFVLFRIPPFGSPNIRAVKKEQKAYLWDWSLIPEPGPRFENLVACQLLKYCDFLEDTQGYAMELRYLRDTDRREVDFVVIQQGIPIFAVECQLKESPVGIALPYFAQRTAIPQFYLVHQGKKDYEHAAFPLRVVPFQTFVKELELP
ncbi:MAG: AAA family ATPase [Omnitrophica bacterium RIFCSPLOWO2_12_FULL_50_11]|nr:MAG: AAA family ATPase [Omnitrophica bacterium RIFCSPLOWO2_12_FULL_50_11]